MDSDDVGGQIHGISLDSFLQMVQMEKTTCTLTVQYMDQVGYLYILDGELIYAETGELKNVEAACRIISWDKSTIEIENSCDRTENEINQPLMNILMEGLKLRDDAVRKAEKQPKPPTAKAAEPAGAESVPPPPAEEPEAEEISDDISLDGLELEPSDEPELEISFEEPSPDPPVEPVDDLSMEPSLEMAEDPSEAPSVDPSMEPPPLELPPELTDEEAEPEEISGRAARYIPIKKKPKVDPKAKLKKKRLIVFSALGILTIIVAVGSVVSMRAVKAQRAEAEYDRVLNAVKRQETPEEKIATLQKYISTRKSGGFVDHAENKIKEIKKSYADRDYQALIAVVDNLPLNESYQQEAMAAYNRYLEKHPESSRTADVRKRMSKIPSVVDDIDYEKLKQVAQSESDVKLAAYNLYLLNHPKGKHRKAVEKMISDMSEGYYDALKKQISVCEAENKWEKCIRMCTYFVSMFKGHRRWDEMVVVKNEMQAKSDLSDLKEEAKQEIANGNYAAAKQIYLTYLENNPDSHVKDEISDELINIDKMLAKKEEWAKIAAMSRDQRYSVYNREQALRRYIADNPSGTYVSEAGKLLGQLESEQRTGSGYQKKTAATSRPQTGPATPDTGLRVETAKIQKARETARAQLKGIDRFVANGDGTFTDSMTGLMWAILDSTAELGRCVDHRSAMKYVKGLTTGGYRDWRMPTSSDLAGIYKSKPFFPVSGAKWYWAYKTYVDGHHVKAGIVTTKKQTIFKREYADVEQCGAVRAVRP